MRPLLITIEKHLADAPAAPSANVLRVAAMFGISLDHESARPLIPRATIPLFDNNRGRVIYVTGPSGSGKSAILHSIEQVVHQLNAQHDERLIKVIRFDRLPHFRRKALVDLFPKLGLERTLNLLSRAGLNDALTFLRTPAQLSDGQRARLRLAQIMATVESSKASDRSIILADEFAAVLDRLTAKIIAHNIAKWARQRKNVAFIAATTHDDLFDALDTDVVIEKPLGKAMRVIDRCAMFDSRCSK